MAVIQQFLFNGGGCNNDSMPTNEYFKGGNGASGQSMGNQVDVGDGRIIVSAFPQNNQSNSGPRIFDLDGSNEVVMDRSSDSIWYSPDSGYSNSSYLSSGFGRMVAVSRDGSNKVAIGAHIWPTAYGLAPKRSVGLLSWWDSDGTNGTYQDTYDWTILDYQGESVDIRDNMVMGSSPWDGTGSGTSRSAPIVQYGSVYFYEFDGTLIQKLEAPWSPVVDGDNFGTSVRFGETKILITSDRAGTNATVSVYDFSRNHEVDIVNPSNASDFFGGGGFNYDTNCVAEHKGKIYIGAAYNDTQATDAGVLYKYDVDGTLESTVYAPSAAASDQFGHSVAVGGGRIFVGAPGRNSNTGAVIVYDLNFNHIGTLTASDASSGDKFGFSVAYGQGKLVVGAPTRNTNVGGAYVYDTPTNYGC